eukprot:4310694-Prymnesium_polylepis.1
MLSALRLSFSHEHREMLRQSESRALSEHEDDIGPMLGAALGGTVAFIAISFAVRWRDRRLGGTESSSRRRNEKALRIFDIEQKQRQRHASSGRQGSPPQPQPQTKASAVTFVVVPEGVAPGQLVQVPVTSGAPPVVTAIPEGLTAGQLFRLNLSDEKRDCAGGSMDRREHDREHAVVQAELGGVPSGQKV